MSDSPGRGQLPLFPRPGRAPAERAPRLAPAPPVRAGATLAVAAGAFDEHLARLGKTDNTRRAFASDLRLAMRHLGPDRTVGEVTTDDLQGFLTWMLEHRGRPCSDKTYARRVTTLKVFFAWLADAGARPDDPAARIVHRRAHAPLPHVLDDAQVAALLAEARRRRDGDAPDPRPEALCRLLLDAGLKKGEVARLRVDDLSLDGAPPTLLVRYDKPRWRRKERRVALTAETAAALRGHLRGADGDRRVFDCTARNLEYVLTEVLESAGLPRRKAFETLRWTSALAAYRAGEDGDALRERLGLSPITWAGTERKLALLADR